MSLLERDPDAPASWQGTLPVTNRYTFGVAGEKFFRALKDEGRILGTHCPDCDFVYVPAALYCERCFRKLDQWVDVGTQGEVLTFTVMFVDYDGSPLKKPEIIAYIQLGDGGLIHRLTNVDPAELAIGMLVKAVLKPKAKRMGSILDIVSFRPI